MTDDALQNLRFENCVIIGPAALALIKGITMIDYGFDAPGADPLLRRVPETIMS